jgi:hypothetical protein
MGLLVNLTSDQLPNLPASSSNAIKRAPKVPEGLRDERDAWL